MSNVIRGYFGPAKKRRMNVVSYVRDFQKTRDLAYEHKFADLYDLCADAASGDFEAVVIAYPEVLGDTYEEMVISLSLLARAGSLTVVTGNSPAVTLE